MRTCGLSRQRRPTTFAHGGNAHTAMLTSLHTLAKALGGEVNGTQVLAPGPGHSVIDRSLSVKLASDAPDGFLVHSFAGDDPIACRDHVREKAGLEPFKPNGGGRHRASNEAIEHALMAAAGQRRDGYKRRIVAKYGYTDATGVLLYQVLRLEPKGFRQRRPDGNGGWIWELDQRRVPYRWPDLLKYPDGTVFFCEGEKDADRVAGLGYCATTVAAGKWTEECVTALAGRDVIILEDNDNTGRARRSRRRRHCTVPRKPSVSFRCRTSPTKATFPIGSMRMRVEPRNWVMFALTCGCGRLTMLLQTSPPPKSPRGTLRLRLRLRAGPHLSRHPCRLSILPRGMARRRRNANGWCRIACR